jgi:site-specific DNA recombinase
MRKFATALYGRTSKDDPRRVTIEIQQAALKDWAGRDHLVDHVVDEYWDDGVTGKLPLWERPEGRRLLADVQAGRIKSVAVAYADRFGRTLLDGLNAVKLLEDQGVKLVAINDGWDARRDDSPLYFQFRMMMAEEEHRRICQRMCDGKARAMDRDNAPPGGPLTFGYRMGSKGEFLPDPDEAPVVIRMFEMALQGASQADILRSVRGLAVRPGRKYQKRLAGSRPETVGRHAKAQWHLTKVGRILRNPVYLGRRQWGERAFPCPPLVDQDTFDKVQALLRDRPRGPGPRFNPDQGLLSGLLTCGICGSQYFRMRTRRRLKSGAWAQYRYYACDRRRKTGGCRGKVLDIARLDAGVWGLVEELLQNPEAVVRRALAQTEQLHTRETDLDREEAACLAELAGLEQEVAQTWAEQRANNWPIAWVSPRLNELNARRELANARLAAARNARAAVSLTREQSDEVTAALAKIRARLAAGLSAAEKSDVIRLLVPGGVVKTAGAGNRKTAEVTIQLRWGDDVPLTPHADESHMTRHTEAGGTTFEVVIAVHRH